MKPLDAADALLFVEVEDGLGVGVRPVLVALGLELGAQGGVVVDLAVVCDPDRSVLVGHRVVPRGREVDNRQPPVTEGYSLTRLDPAAGVVRTAVRNRVAHA